MIHPRIIKIYNKKIVFTTKKMKTIHQLDRISNKRTNATDTEDRVETWQAKTLV